MPIPLTQAFVFLLGLSFEGVATSSAPVSVTYAVIVALVLVVVLSAVGVSRLRNGSGA